MKKTININWKDALLGFLCGTSLCLSVFIYYWETRTEAFVIKNIPPDRLEISESYVITRCNDDS